MCKSCLYALPVTHPAQTHGYRDGTFTRHGQLGDMVTPLYLVRKALMDRVLDYDASCMGTFYSLTQVDCWQSTLYDEKIPVPPTDPFLTLVHFGGGIPTESGEFRLLVTSGLIAVLPLGTLMSTSDSSVTFSTSDGPKTGALQRGHLCYGIWRCPRLHARQSW